MNKTFFWKKIKKCKSDLINFFSEKNYYYFFYFKFFYYVFFLSLFSLTWYFFFISFFDFSNISFLIVLYPYIFFIKKVINYSSPYIFFVSYQKLLNIIEDKKFSTNEKVFYIKKWKKKEITNFEGSEFVDVKITFLVDDISFKNKPKEKEFVIFTNIPKIFISNIQEKQILNNISFDLEFNKFQKKFDFFSGIYYLFFLIIIILGFFNTFKNFYSDVDLNIIYSEDVKKNISDIKGYKKVKEEMTLMVNYIKRYKKKPFKSIIFYGPPGTGKTTFAKALAKSISHSFVATNGIKLSNNAIITEIVGKNFSSLKILKLMSKVSKIASKDNNIGILIIDEYDKISNRNLVGEELLEVLESVDEKNSFENVLLILTTNHIDNFIKSVLRQGRIEKHIELDYPEKEDLEEIISHYLETTNKISELNASEKKKIKEWYVDRVKGNFGRERFTGSDIKSTFEKIDFYSSELQDNNYHSYVTILLKQITEIETNK